MTEEFKLNIKYSVDRYSAKATDFESFSNYRPSQVPCSNKNGMSACNVYIETDNRSLYLFISGTSAAESQRVIPPGWAAYGPSFNKN